MAVSISNIEEVLLKQYSKLLKLQLAGKPMVMRKQITQQYIKLFKQSLGSGYNIDLGTLNLSSAENARIAKLYNSAVKFSAVKQARFIADMELAGDSFETAELGTWFESYYFTQNRVWLQAEMEMITANAQMAERWHQMQELDTLPNLEYVTVGDTNVRPDHVLLDGTNLPMDDPFWDVYYPPNGFRCRCDVKQNEKKVKSKTTKLTDNAGVPKAFRFNAGKTNQVVSNEHPYYEGQNMSKIKAHCILADPIYKKLNAN